MDTFNNGTVNLSTAGFKVNLSAVVSGIHGFKITDTSAGGADLTGSTKNDTIVAGAGNDTISGVAGSDSLSAGDGDDTITGFIGTDSVDGGLGLDTLSLSGANDLALATNTQLVGVEKVLLTASTNVDLDAQTEGFTITGSTGNDTITGGIGNDTIAGGTGADVFVLNSGTDTISDLGNGGDVLQVGAGIAFTSAVSVAWTAGAGTANNGTVTLTTNGLAVNLAAATGGTYGFKITDTSTLGTSLAGSGQADTITAGAGDDTITGFAGADSVDGGVGLDTLSLSGTPTGLATALDTQLVGVEKILLTASANVDLDAQSEGFTITGSTGADTIIGGAGNDTIAGGAGIDVFVLNSGTDAISDLGNGGDVLQVGTGIAFTGAVSAAWTAGAGTANNGTVTLTTNGLAVNLAAATGGTHGFKITDTSTLGINLAGSAQADTIVAGAGDDTITGFAGTDSVDGGVGLDTLSLSGTPTGLATALDTQLVGVEKILLTASANVDLDTQSEGFTITGSTGADTIISGAGNDTIAGGTGIDKFIVNGGTDTISDLANGGVEVLQVVGSSAVVNATLFGAWAATVDTFNNGTVNLSTAGFAVNLGAVTSGTHGFTITDGSSLGTSLAGSAQTDIISAGDGDDTITGFAGADSVDGGLGIDTLRVNGTLSTLTAALDGQLKNVENITVDAAFATTINLSAQAEGFTITGGTAADIIIGGAGADTIRAGLQNDELTGGTGNDVLVGEKGQDTLTGGAGSDTFSFNAGDSGMTLTTLDYITDYAKGAFGVGDLIDYSAALAIGGSSAAAIATEASINQTTGVAAFMAGSATTLADALTDIATRFTTATDASGEFAFFKLNGAGDYYLFISDGVAGVSTNDVVVDLLGVSSIASINLTGGGLTITT